MRVLILANSNSFLDWELEILEVFKRKSTSLDLWLPMEPYKGRISFRLFAFRIFRKLDSIISGTSFKRVSYTKFDLTEYVNVRRTLFRDFLELPDGHYDYCCRLGMRIIDGPILSIPSGILSFHHGDNRINRGGPPAFWEWYTLRMKLGITLQVLNANLDGGKVVARESIDIIPLSYTQTLKNAQAKSAYLLQDYLDGKYIHFNDDFFDIYSDDLYKTPEIIGSLRALKKLVYRRLEAKRGLRNEWIVGVGKTSNSSRYLLYSGLIANRKNAWFADPFLFENESTTYLICEEFSLAKKKGQIVYSILDDKGKPKSWKSLLVCDYHLSFPTIFEWKGEYWLLVESSQANRVDCYPLTLNQGNIHLGERNTLISERCLLDPVMLIRDGVMYLFATEYHSGSKVLRMYVSKVLVENSFEEHPMSPISYGDERARNGGVFFEKEQALYRVSQTANFDYGDGLMFFKVSELSETKYSESKVHEHRSIKYRVHTLNFSSKFYSYDRSKRRFNNYN